MKYRTATAQDAKWMVNIHFNAVHAISHEIYTRNILESWSPKPNEVRIKWLTDTIESDHTYSIIAEDINSEIVGFAILQIGKNALQALYVNPSSKGKGVGKMLLNRIEEYALEVGINNIQLKSSLNSVSFYKDRGFIEVSKSMQELTNGEYMESISMQKSLCNNA